MNAKAICRRRWMHFAGTVLFSPMVGATPPAKYEEVGWPALIPTGWNPGKVVRDLQAMGDLPDEDPRVIAASERARKVLDAAPTVAAMNGRAVKLAGFVVPLELGPRGMREFLLVPYFGACIHAPAPPANQVVHVRSKGDIKGLRSMSTVWASGILKVERSTAAEGISGYRMDGVDVQPYNRR